MIILPVAAVALFAGVLFLAPNDKHCRDLRKLVRWKHHPPTPQFDNGRIEFAISFRSRKYNVRELRVLGSVSPSLRQVAHSVCQANPMSDWIPLEELKRHVTFCGLTLDSSQKRDTLMGQPQAFRLQLSPAPFLNYPEPLSSPPNDSHAITRKTDCLARNSESPRDNNITQFEPRTELAQNSLVD